MIADAIIKIHLLTFEEGGRRQAIAGKKYGCPVVVNSENFDCRFVYERAIELNLGLTYEIPVKFLDPDRALKILHEGVEISLWEGKIIGTGVVIKIL